MKIFNFSLQLFIFHFALLIFILPLEARAGLLVNRPLYLGLNAGLVGYWSFNGPDMAGTTAYDRSGQGNNGTLTNMNTRSSTVKGKIGQGLNFDGVDDYVSISLLNSVYDFDTFTYSAWIKPSAGSDPYGGLLAENNLKGIFHIGTGGNAGKISFYHNNADHFNNTALSNGVWSHVVVVTNPVGITFYVNGVPDGTNTSPSGIDFIWIGNDNTSEAFLGGIDDVRIYNRALSQDEIKRLYKIGATLKINTTISNDSLKNGLVGHWSFDGPTVSNTSIVDLSGQANHGTMTNMNTKSAIVSGKIGQALDFDGANDYVNLSTPASLDLDTSLNDVTVAAWIRLAIDPNLRTGIFGGSTDVQYWAATLGDSNSGDRQFTYYSDDPAGSEISSAIHANTAVPVGEWHHVAFTRSAAGGVLNYYYDGLPDGSATGTFSQPMNGNKIIGGRENTGQFPGLIDDVRIYNRVLTTDEIKRLYKIGATFKVNTTISNDSLRTGLVGHWTFNGPDMAGTTAYDRSGQANNGTLTNGPVRTTGKLGQGLEFDGVNDYVSLGTTGLLLSSGSVSFWVKSTADSGPDTAFSVGKTTQSSYFTIALGDGSTALCDNELISIFTNDAGSALNRICYTTTNRKELFDGNWHHIVVVASSAYQLYLDGQSKAITVGDGSNNGQFTDIAGLNAPRIGNTNDLGTDKWFMQGTLDDVHVYNRALTPDEVKRLYNLGR